MTQLPTPELGEMELTWQEIMSITELQVSWVGAGAGKHRDAESLAATEAGGWNKQGSGSQVGNVPGTGKGRAGVGRRSEWMSRTLRDWGCG